MPEDPFDDFEQLFETMSRQFGQSEAVAVDVADVGDAFVVVADLPGYGRDAIEATLTDETTVHLGADRAEDERIEPRRWLRRERHGRAVSRTVTLPEPVDDEGCEASYEDGVLTVRLPKRGASDDAGQTIPVE